MFTGIVEELGTVRRREGGELVGVVGEDFLVRPLTSDCQFHAGPGNSSREWHLEDI